MPFPIQQLIEGRALVVTISPNLSVAMALGLMMKHDFSQLPIVDEDNHVQGIVTSDSILRGLHFTKTTTTKLHVIDIKTDAPMCLPDDDIFEVLERMRNNYACLVVDDEKSLIGIITDFDTSEYFRRRAENIMLVEDIERTLKDFILFAYPRADGTENSDLVMVVQQAVAPPREFDNFKRAIAKYLQEAKVEIAAVGLDDAKFNPKHAENAYKMFTAPNSTPKTFDDLTMAEYISVFLNGARWAQYQVAIRLDKEAIYQMLDAVRLIRNKLAHFTGEVTETEQEQLRYCLKWLENHQSVVDSAFQPAESETKHQVVTTPQELEASPIKHLREPGDSRYAPLARYLRDNANMGSRILTLAFTEIEEIIDVNLPPYARKHRSWWANDSEGHVQSKQWLNAG